MASINFGTAKCKIAIVGAYPPPVGTDNPFAGSDGALLRNMLAHSNLNIDECFFTHVLGKIPSSNDPVNFCSNKSTVQAAWEEMHNWTKPEFTPAQEKANWKKAQKLLPINERSETFVPSSLATKPIYPWKAYKSPGKYFMPEYVKDSLIELQLKLQEVKPNVILALGSVPTWALLGSGAVGTLRGAVAESALIPGTKVLPTFSASSVNRDWAARSSMHADVDKAIRESEFPEIRYPEKEIWINPSLADCEKFEELHIVGAKLLSIDIECTPTQITCIGFAPNSTHALVVPFSNTGNASGSYWATKEDEIAALNFVRKLCANSIPKLFHNGVFDITFLAAKHNIFVLNAREDTMLAHHALQPEMKKGLGFLATVYLNTPAWKNMRTDIKAKDASTKSDE